MAWTTLNSAHATGDVITATELNNAWANIMMLGAGPLARATRSTTQSIANNTDTVVLWDTESKDTDSMHSTVSNTGRITVQTAGFFIFAAPLTLAPCTGTTYAYVLKNGAGNTVGFDSRNAFGISQGYLCWWADQCAVADYFEVHIMQQTGAAVNLLNTNSLYVGYRIAA